MLLCTTCELSADGGEMSKHLRSTRHKCVRDLDEDEVVVCEECEDSNIHQLRVLRFGFNDMALLCQSCMDKEEKASVQYSLENGSLLQKLSQYYQFRDTACEQCGNDSRLNVVKAGSTKVVLCRKCLGPYAESHPGAKATSEDDDNFLSELLGITQYVPSGKKKFSRNSARGRTSKRGKRGGARGHSKSDAPESEKDIEAQKRRDHYFNKLEVTKALKSGSTVSAVGQGSSGKGAAKLGPKGAKGSRAGPGQKSSSGPSSKASSPHPRSKQSPAVSARASPAASAKASPAVSRASPAASGRNSPAPRTADKPSRSKTPAKDDKKFGNEKSPRARPDDVKSKPNGSSEGKSTSKDSAKPGKKDPKKDKSKEKPKDGPKDKSKDKSKEPKSKDSKSKDKSKESKSNGKDAKSKPNAPERLSASRESTPVEAKPELPTGITRYVPSKTPKLTYDSMDEYFREISYNLFLEDKISLDTGGGLIIEPEDMFLSWYQDQDKTNKQFKVEIELNEQFMSKLNNKKNLKFKKTLFSVGQSMFLVLDGDIPWYGLIALSETRKTFVKRQKLETQELIIQLYNWNYQNLPKSVNVKRLTLVPASIPIGRTLWAMSNIVNPKFKKMILGHDPIKQISFNNYIKFSDESKFNQSQKVAVQSVLNNSITVLQGPPGTGKTSTIYEIILQLLSNLNTYPILVVAASNIAVDNIAEKLMDTHKLQLLRIVSMEKESDYKQDHKLHSICLHKKVYDMLPEHMKEVHRKLRGPRSNEVSVTQYKKFLQTWIQFSDLIIPQARVIFTTSVAAGGNQLKSMPRFPVVIMDEATQSSEATTLIPLSMPGVEKFVFVGDQRQLSSFTQVPALSLSLFERVILNGTYQKPQMLDTQYRMHPMISDFPRNKFYDGLLQDGVTAEARTQAGVTKPVFFWDTKGKKPEDRVRIRVREDGGSTYVNRGEIGNIVEVVTDLLVTKKIANSEIGIITPYSGQRDLISQTLTKNDVINPEKLEIKVEVDRDDIEHDSKPVTIHVVSDIMIASIDAFQGREKDFIVFSCVRSNAERKIGFLNDARRLNVALTRARYGLILIGDRATLESDPLWGEYLEHLGSRGCIHDEFDY